MERAAQMGYPACKKCMEMTPEETDADLIVTEGAAYTPQVMGQYGADDYISIVPTPAFQISHYREREWVPYILRDCTDREKAFDNWMKRDILFATVEKLFALTGF